MMKICAKCRKEKPTTEFGLRKRNKDGLQYRCKQCVKEESDALRDHRNELERKRYHKNREFFVAKTSKYRYKVRGKELPEKFAKLLVPKTKKAKTYEDTLVRLREYKRRNKTKLKEKYKEWSSTPKAKLLNRLKSQRRRASLRELPNTLKREQVTWLLNFQRGCCGDCGIIFSDKIPFEIDHVVPVIKGGATVIENVQLLCRSCNARKKDKVKRYIPEIGNLYPT